MAQAEATTDLKTALAEFETRLATPIISGELSTWILDVAKASEEFCQQLTEAVQHLHPEQFKEMAEADAEMLPRVDSLKAEDEALQAECERLGARVKRDAQIVPTFEPDEGKAKSHVQSLIDEGLAFVIRVRKQEVAIETWLVEAFNRDRGAVD